MSTAMLKRKSALYAKVETTPGTEIALALADGAFNAFDAEMNQGIEFEDRPIQNTYSFFKGVTGAQMGSVSFKTELHGSGSAGGAAAVPTWADIFLPAAGIIPGGSGSEHIFNPSSEAPSATSSVKTLTIGLYEDGRKKTLIGCMAESGPVIVFEFGKRIMLEWTFIGKWIDPIDAAAPGPVDYPSVAPIKFLDANFTLGVNSSVIRGMSLDLGNAGVMRPDGNDATGFATAVISNRDARGTLNIDSELVADEDVYGDFLDDAEKAIALSIAGPTAAGNTVAISIPKAQYVNPQTEENDNILGEAIEFRMNANTDAGDDEFTITFT